MSKYHVLNELFGNIFVVHVTFFFIHYTEPFENNRMSVMFLDFIASLLVFLLIINHILVKHDPNQL